MSYCFTVMGGGYSHRDNQVNMLRADARHKWHYAYTGATGGMRAARTAEE